ncbi:PREDICTED: neuroligin-4, Y-linked isoform X2 [Nicrophorus vespilloides]|uniref:Neuroligin-4, Y-linked isoform X2 n=1 Tax=Nicrophorus vespilloides TaxID=110193 RepID=A0ABM1N5S3_NICVS|nr:PREDICTED: neuroligin-4, Y-linked isoform X2 [Nicrophorus vespilloides]
MALGPQQVHLPVFMTCVWHCFVLITGQTYPDHYQQYNQYPQDNGYWPNADRDHRTYIYHGRRYGQYQPNGYNGQERPGDPNRIGEDERFSYDQEGNSRPILPGILADWREDLQGTRREGSNHNNQFVHVKTKYGNVQGFKVYLYDNPDPDSYYRPVSEHIHQVTGTTTVFLGIPYALPPTGEGRFKPPRRHKGWQILEAVDFGPACPQPSIYTGATKGIRDVNEDCLYLNIYTPSTEDVGKKYPVMFYIHGGDFAHGASNHFPGHIMATFYKVVIVTINYRLGALGFLSTADINSPGNYGILDQAMALKWVYENIEFFNGDSSSITLFGPGAGAASAGLLMVAPETKHMVSKVIGQSGSAVADWAMIMDQYRAQNTSRVFGQLVGCSIDSSWKLVNCLKSRSANELGNAEFPPHIGLFPWAPVIDFNLTMPFYEGWNERDWHFMDSNPENLIRQGHFNRGLKYMASVTMQEAADFIYKNDSLSPYYVVDEVFFEQKVKELVLRYNYTLNPNGTYEAIKYMYTYWPDPHNVTHIREKYIELLSDFLYVSPNDKMIKLLLEKDVKVYMYVLNTTVESFKNDFWRKTPHNIEHYLLTGAPFMDVEFFPKKERFHRLQWTNNDRNMSHFFMKAYTDFARHGTPSFTQIFGLHFEQARNGQLTYLNLNTTYNSSIMWNYRQTESAFWTQYLPMVVGNLVVTLRPTTEFWYEPSTPLQIAFWSMSTACLFLVVLLVVCCMLWRNAKRQSRIRKEFLTKSDRYYNGDFIVTDNDTDLGIENTRSPEIYEYTDKPRSNFGGTSSAASFRTSSGSLKEMQEFTTSSPNGEVHRKGTPVLGSRRNTRTKVVQGIPQTDV